MSREGCRVEEWFQSVCADNVEFAVKTLRKTVNYSTQGETTLMDFEELR